MAIAVSQGYKDVQARRGGKRARVVVQYKRRYFDPVAVAFAYEPNFHVLAQNQFSDPGEIVDQLDIAEPGIFKATTVTLRLKNTRNQWARSVNDPSVFAADALAPNGYYDDQTIFQVMCGYLKADGTWEDCPQFTGFVADITPLPKQGFVEVQVSASLLAEKCAAIKVNTAVTAEAMALSIVDEPLNPSPGDGTTAVLKTTATGVISVSNVKADGVALVLTTDYTVSIPTNGTVAKIALVTPASWTGKAMTWSGITQNLLTTSSAVTLVSKVYANTVGLVQGDDYTVTIPTGVVGQAQITLTDPELWIGQSFTWDGAKGSLNKTVEQAVAMYCDASGIGSSSRSIQAVLFPGGLSGSKTIDTQADWQAGALLQNASTLQIPGSLIQKWYLIDDFSDGDYTSNPVWSVINGSGIFDASSGALVVTKTSSFPYISTPFSQATGTRRFRASFTGTSSDIAVFMASNAPTSTIYSINFDGTTIRLNRFISSVSTVQLINAGAISAGFHEYRLTRTSAGLMELFIDGVSKGTATDTTITAPVAFGITVGNGSVTIDDIYWSPDIDGTSTFSSTACIAEYQFNLLSTPTALGTLDHFEVLNSGAAVYKTACAPDSSGSPGTYDALQTLGAGNQMQSTPRQWLKLRVEITPAAGTFTSPEVQKLVANFTLSTITLSQVAPTTGTAWDRIQVYARMCNYETGWDPNGIFFFRSRRVSGAPVITLDPWTNIIDLDDAHPGWDRVFNIGHAIQTPYEYFYGKDDASEAEPTSERRFGASTRDLDFSSELVANDAQIGKAAAQVAYLDNFLPRWRCRVPVKQIPWLQLSDPVSLTFVTDPKMIENIAGDPLQTSGFAGPQGVALALNKKMKIVGITKKLKACTADLLLEEILS